MIKAVLFDLDGTVLNTLPDLAGITNRTLAALGYSQRTLEEIRQFVGNGMKKLIGRALPEGVALTDGIIRRMLQEYKNCDNSLTLPYDGIVPVLWALRRAGIKTAVVTNKPDAIAVPLIEQKLPGLFDAVRGNRPDEPVKPDPYTTLETAKLLGFRADECIFVGDSDTDQKTAENARILCLNATWGFRDAAFLAANGAKHLIQHPFEILDAVFS